MTAIFLRLLCFTFILLVSATVTAATCTDMMQVAIDTVTITAAEAKAAGTVKSLFGDYLLTVPPHCRLAAVLSPTEDSHIEMELWLPDQWNGKFLAVGNGGWAGSISFAAMARGMQAGYAVASNDTGHQGGSAAFALGHPEKLVDFAWRAMHEMAIQSKILIERYYAQVPRLSYYEGCSTGGRQGMMEAQRFPADFDAIIAGAPVNNMLALSATQLHDIKTLIENRAMALSPEKVQMLHAAVLADCEDSARGGDGVDDGILNNPLACGFKPESLLCTGAGNLSCLSENQITAVNNAYGGVFSAAGAQLYPGHAKGFEPNWRIPAENTEPLALHIDATRYVAYADPDWDWRDFEVGRDLALVREKAGYIEAVETDLSEFKNRGGKILFYHGWNDPGPSPINTINYYNGVLETMGPDQGDWLRLYLMPGMGHCSGGIGPDSADFLGAMEAWVEKGHAPERITAARIREGRVDMTRPLCPYPQVAAWNGHGSPNDAASYTCQSPAK